MVEYLLSFRVYSLTAQDIELFKRRTTIAYTSANPTVHIEQNRLRSPADTPATLGDFLSTLPQGRSSFCPLNLDIYSNNGRTALHEAIEQQNLALVQLLVANGASVNLPYEDVASRAANDEQCFIMRSTALSCACRLANIPLIEYLLTSLATDKECLAYNACQHSYLVGHLLKYRALPDNEFKLVKRQLTSNTVYLFDDDFWSKIDLTKIWMNTAEERKDDNNNTLPDTTYSMEPMLKRRSSKRYHILTTNFEQIRNRFSTRPSLTPNVGLASLSIPSTPVGIQWHHYGPLKTLDPLWFIQASIFVNKETFKRASDINAFNRHLLLHCITRVDLSDNSLECVPAFLFQMYSLRILNISNNQLGELPNDAQTWLCHQLVELDVSHNALTCLPSAMFHLRSLQRAYAGRDHVYDRKRERERAGIACSS